MKNADIFNCALIVLFFVLYSQTVFSEPGENTSATNMQAETASQPLIEETGFSKGEVSRAIFTTDVINREPVDDLKQISTETGIVKFFTDLRDMSGHKVIHRWEYGGKVISEIEYEVRGPRWRIWSSKNMMPDWVGMWTVSVVNTVGEVIDTRQFEYIESIQ